MILPTWIIYCLYTCLWCLQSEGVYVVSLLPAVRGFARCQVSTASLALSCQASSLKLLCTGLFISVTMTRSSGPRPSSGSKSHMFLRPHLGLKPGACLSLTTIKLGSAAGYLASLLVDSSQSILLDLCIGKSPFMHSSSTSCSAIHLLAMPNQHSQKSCYGSWEPRFFVSLARQYEQDGSNEVDCVITLESSDRLYGALWQHYRSSASCLCRTSDTCATIMFHNGVRSPEAIK